MGRRPGRPRRKGDLELDALAAGLRKVKEVFG
jgi:hypothetical protein